jgi:hypothetical protein
MSSTRERDVFTLAGEGAETAETPEERAWFA